MKLKKLNKIIIDPNNPRYKIYENNFIIGKSSTDQENYDILVFCVRNIEIAKIPDFIEIIGSYAFNSCQLLKRIEFTNNSKLRIIEKNAFDKSSIDFLFIPPTLIRIGSCAFYYCENLQRIEIADNSELCSIGEYAFANSSIENFKITHNIEYIGKNAFSDCNKLQNIEFPVDCKLNTIEKDTFFGTLIKSILIPPSVVELKNGWCHNMPKLLKIHIMKNNLRYSSYDEDKILLEKSSFDIENYDILVLCVGNPKSVTIPNYIKSIRPHAFEKCHQLQNIKFSKNTELQKYSCFMCWTK